MEIFSSDEFNPEFNLRCPASLRWNGCLGAKPGSRRADAAGPGRGIIENLLWRKTAMKPTPLLLASVLLATGAIPVAAALAEGGAQARQAPSCGEWIAHREKSSTLALGDTSWLLGYLSGAAASSGKDHLSGTDNASIYRWMDDYCRANPLRDVASGAKTLAAEGVGRKAAPK